MKTAEMVTNGNMWQHPYKAVDVLCFDGKRRTVRLNLEASTWFCWPGRCTIGKKTVRGYVSSHENALGISDLIFRLYDDSWEKLGMEKPEISQDILATLHSDEIAKQMLQDDYSGDPWGVSMNWFFGLCDFLHFIRKIDTPRLWEYKPGLGQSAMEDPDSFLEFFQEFSNEHLLFFGYFLFDLTTALKNAGKSY